MNKPIKVHLYGSENNGGARESLLHLDGLVELTFLDKADVIHSVWDEPLFQIDQNVLVGKRIVCQLL